MKVNRTLILLFALMLVGTNASGQDLFDRFKQKADERYDNFRDQCNTRYAKFLAEGWKKFRGEKPVPAPDQHDKLPKDVLEKMKDPELMVAEVKTSDATDGVRFRGAMMKVREFFGGKPATPMVEMRSDYEKRKAERQAARNEAQRRKRELAEHRAAEKEATDVEQEVDVTPIAPAVERQKRHTFVYYGTPMAVEMGDLPQRLHIRDLQPQTVANAWTLCSRKEYVGLIQDCLELRDQYSLCDWAYLQMLKTMADAHLGEDSNESTFLTAYIFCQSGYRIRLAQGNGRLLMLYGSEHMVYNQPFIKMDGLNLYPLGAKVDRLSTIQACDKAINDSEQPMSLLMGEEPALEMATSKVRRIESDKYPEVNMEVSVNENLIKFFNDYPVSGASADPLSKWAMYANTPLAEEVKAQVYPRLQQALNGLSEQDKVRRLLSLIQPRVWDKPQTSLQYEYDDKEWGHDRVFFAEETLYYPYSDCEDHAILFARLVRDLMGLKVMLVYYPGHLATAVQFSRPLTGKYQDRLILENGDEYYICDPTNYVPEPGVTMEGMNNAQAKVVMLD